jgi:thioesterase domain-containing protein
MDELSAKLEQAGVRSHVFQDSQDRTLASQIVKQYKDVKNPEPLCLVGHSYGADDVLRVAHTLKKHGIKVDLLVTVDATVPPPVPSNVAVCYNYYQSQVTDFIPLFRGIALKQEAPDAGVLVNTDLRKDRKDLLKSNTNHINIDKNERVQDVVVGQVLDVCPPRNVWLARNGVSPDPQKASAVLPGARTARSPQAADPAPTELGR